MRSPEWRPSTRRVLPSGASGRGYAPSRCSALGGSRVARQIRSARRGVGARVRDAACWPQPGGNPGHTNHNGLEDRLTIDVVGSLEEAWQAPLQLGPVWGASVMGVEVGADGTPGSAHAAVVARDAATGVVRWATDVIDPSAPLEATRAFATDPVVVGRQLWTSVELRDDTWCASSSWRLDRDSGAVRARSYGRPPSGLVAYGDLVYAQLPQACIAGPMASAVLDAATAAPVWTPPAYIVFGGVYDAGRLMISGGSTISSFDGAGCGASSCSPQWTVAIGDRAASEATVDGVLVARVTPADTTSLVALDTADGSTLWTTVLPPGEPVVDVAVAAGTVYVTHGSTLAAYDLTGCGAPACAPQWSAALGAPASAGPVSAAGVVYVGEADGTVQAFDAAGCGATACAEVAHVAVDGRVTTLIVDGGRLFVESGAASDPTTTAFAPDPAA